jgi:hypothetical protein
VQPTKQRLAAEAMCGCPIVLPLLSEPLTKVSVRITNLEGLVSVRRCSRRTQGRRALAFRPDGCPLRQRSGQHLYPQHLTEVLGAWSGNPSVSGSSEVNRKVGIPFNCENRVTVGLWHCRASSGNVLLDVLSTSYRRTCSRYLVGEVMYHPLQYDKPAARRVLLVNAGSCVRTKSSCDSRS